MTIMKPHLIRYSVQFSVGNGHEEVLIAGPALCSLHVYVGYRVHDKWGKCGHHHIHVINFCNLKLTFQLYQFRQLIL